MKSNTKPNGIQKNQSPYQYNKQPEHLSMQNKNKATPFSPKDGMQVKIQKPQGGFHVTQKPLRNGFQIGQQSIISSSQDIKQVTNEKFQANLQGYTKSESQILQLKYNANHKDLHNGLNGISQSIQKEPQVNSQFPQNGTFPPSQFSQNGHQIQSYPTQNKSHQELQEKLFLARKQELLVEHFGFTPLSFIDDVINSVNERMYSGLSTFESYISRIVPDQNEAAEAMNKVDTLLETAVDKNFDVFELYALNNIFGLLEHEPLPPLHYQDLDLNHTDEDRMQAELELERQKLLQAQLKNSKLSELRARNVTTQTQLENLAEITNPLAAVLQINGNPSTDVIQFAFDQGRALLKEEQAAQAYLQKPEPLSPTLRDLYFQRTIMSSIARLPVDESIHSLANQNLEYDFESFQKQNLKGARSSFGFD